MKFCGLHTLRAPVCEFPHPTQSAGGVRACLHSAPNECCRAIVVFSATHRGRLGLFRRRRAAVPNAGLAAKASPSSHTLDEWPHWDTANPRNFQAWRGLASSRDVSARAHREVIRETAGAASRQPSYSPTQLTRARGICYYLPLCVYSSQVPKQSAR